MTLKEFIELVGKYELIRVLHGTTSRVIVSQSVGITILAEKPEILNVKVEHIGIEAVDDHGIKKVRLVAYLNAEEYESVKKVKGKK